LNGHRPLPGHASGLAFALRIFNIRRNLGVSRFFHVFLLAQNAQSVSSSVGAPLKILQIFRIQNFGSLRQLRLDFDGGLRWLENIPVTTTRLLGLCRFDHIHVLLVQHLEEIRMVFFLNILSQKLGIFILIIVILMQKK
jgi:hypothetical protein